MSLPQTVHLELLLTPDLGGFCLFSYAPRQPVLQNSWKDSLESTCATMVPFMLVMSLEKTKQKKKKHHEEPINKRKYEATSPPGGTRDLSSAGRPETHFLHMVQLFFGAGLCEKAERQLVEQKRCVEPLRW